MDKKDSKKEKQDRLAQALRDNLKRRKQQIRPAAKNSPPPGKKKD